MRIDADGDSEDNPCVWRRPQDRRACCAYLRRRRVGVRDRVRQQRPPTRRRAAVFICGVDVDDERPHCACDVLSATPCTIDRTTPRTAVRLATTSRSMSTLCVFASRRPRPASPTTSVCGFANNDRVRADEPLCFCAASTSTTNDLTRRVKQRPTAVQVRCQRARLRKVELPESNKESVHASELVRRDSC